MLVSGRVQGVYYRDTCRRVAVGAGVGGWVRNLDDGRVEAVFEGPLEAVERLVAWTRQGPAEASVSGVEIHAEAPEGLAVFAIR